MSRQDTRADRRRREKTKVYAYIYINTYNKTEGLFKNILPRFDNVSNVSTVGIFHGHIPERVPPTGRGKVRRTRSLPLRAT